MEPEDECKFCLGCFKFEMPVRPPRADSRIGRTGLESWGEGAATGVSLGNVGPVMICTEAGRLEKSPWEKGADV